MDDTGGTSTIYSDTSGEANTRYIYRVSGVNAAGTGELSRAVEITFRPTPRKPGRPPAL